MSTSVNKSMCPTIFQLELKLGGNLECQELGKWPLLKLAKAQVCRECEMRSVNRKCELKNHTKGLKVQTAGSIFFFLSCNITESSFSALSRFNFLANLKGCSSHEIKRCLLLGRIAMTNLDSILKSNHFGDKGLPSQNYGFSSSHI